MEKLSKNEAKEKIDAFFKHLKGKSPKEISKMKKLAMKDNIPLGERRKLFCKKCFVALNHYNSSVRIKKGRKRIVCENCKYVSRWKIK